MPLTVGVPRETFPGERRVALIPRSCDGLIKAGLAVLVEQSAGVEAGYPDEQYAARGAAIASRDEVFARADVLLQVRTLSANPEAGREDLPRLRAGQVVIGTAEPLTAFHDCADLAKAGVTSFAMEL